MTCDRSKGSSSDENGNDVIVVGAGAKVDSGAGNDLIAASENSTIDAGDGDDKIYSWSNTRVRSGDGNDIIDGWSESFVDGGSGDDLIRIWSNSIANGGAGNDRIDAWADSAVDGGEGDDRIAAWINSKVDGGSGADSISAFSNSVVSGGTGDDQITLTGGGSVLRYGSGDGADSVAAYGAGYVLALGAGLDADKMKISVENGQTVITFDGNDTDQIILRGNAQFTVQFTDGSSRTIDVTPPRVTPQPLPFSLSDARLFKQITNYDLDPESGYRRVTDANFDLFSADGQVASWTMHIFKVAFESKGKGGAEGADLTPADLLNALNKVRGELGPIKTFPIGVLDTLEAKFKSLLSVTASPAQGSAVTRPVERPLPYSKTDAELFKQITGYDLDPKSGYTKAVDGKGNAPSGSAKQLVEWTSIAFKIAFGLSEHNNSWPIEVNPTDLLAAMKKIRSDFGFSSSSSNSVLDILEAKIQTLRGGSPSSASYLLAALST